MCRKYKLEPSLVGFLGIAACRIGDRSPQIERPRSVFGAFRPLGGLYPKPRTLNTPNPTRFRTSRFRALWLRLLPRPPPHFLIDSSTPRICCSLRSFPVCPRCFSDVDSRSLRPARPVGEMVRLEAGRPYEGSDSV